MHLHEAHGGYYARDDPEYEAVNAINNPPVGDIDYDAEEARDAQALMALLMREDVRLAADLE